MSDTTTPAPAPKRSAAEIEDDLARTRDELTDTVNALSARLNPKTQLDNAKATAKATAVDLNEKAMAVADNAAGTVADLAEKASLKGKSLAEDAAAGDVKAVAIITGVVAAAASLVAAAFFRRR
jgi:hypothetical protein